MFEEKTEYTVYGSIWKTNLSFKRDQITLCPLSNGSDLTNRQNQVKQLVRYFRDFSNTVLCFNVPCDYPFRFSVAFSTEARRLKKSLSFNVVQSYYSSRNESPTKIQRLTNYSFNT